MTTPVRKACVIGWPISHSRSPMIHGYWLEKYAISGAYTREAVKSDQLAEFLAAMQANGFAGCNVTVPHKERAFELAAIKQPSAVAVGAANTLWFEDGHLVADNTDTYGFMTNLNATAPQWRRGGDRVVVLGAGGSARAVVYGCLEAGVTHVAVVNRSIARAQELARHFGARVSAHGWDERGALARDAALIVNTTTLGMNGVGDPDIDFATVRTDGVVADLVYVPLETAFLRAARAAQLATVGGLGMLLHQAVPGFEKWFGVRPDVTEDLVQRIEADVAKSLQSNV